MHTAAQADAGKPVDYLKGRGINTVPDNAMLLPAKLAHKLRGRIPLFRDFPAMVLPVTDGKHLLGAHVTFLSKDGTAQAKAAHEPKLTYGPIRGGYIQLCELDHENLPEKLIVAEGIETALSASAITGLPAVAAMNAANMKVVNLPNCREIIIAADNDANGVS